jgi:hypothetical protein
MHEYKLRYFIPYALAVAVVKREGRIIRDLSMPPLDVSKYDAPACMRRTSKRIRTPRERVSIKQAE